MKLVKFNIVGKKGGQPGKGGCIRRVTRVLGMKSSSITTLFPVTCSRLLDFLRGGEGVLLSQPIIVLLSECTA